MVYPVFEETSIAARCLEDIKKFTLEYKITDTVEVTLVSIFNNKKDLTDCIDNLKQKIVAILDDNNSYIDLSDKVTYYNFDYSHHVKYFKLDAQQRLWILRTYVFYQLMIFATKIMTFQKLFGELYPMPNKRVWRPDVVDELKNYKMGIFGSLTPTSDIDVGIAYTGFTTLTALSYVVSIVEDMFLIFMGKSSLQLDIEPYADMYVLPNPNSTSEDDSLIFYLDTTEFSPEDNEKMLPYVGASILRNYVTAQKDLNPDDDTNRIINDFKWNDAFAYFTDQSPDAINFYNNTRPSNTNNSVHDNDVFTNENQVVETESWQGEAKNMIIDYMTKEYKSAREAYYNLVQTAEESIIPIKQNIFPQLQVSPDNKITKDMVINAMQKISHALVFRAESYTCAPTIMHVVRILQLDKLKKQLDPKYETITPEWCETNTGKINTTPICKIGLYGYLMSMFEQLGYMYRFHLTYCIGDHEDKNKCNAKIKKYKERLENAVHLYKRKLAQLQRLSRTFKKPKGGSRKRKSKQTIRKRGGKRHTRKPRNKIR
jgi:hypothetical protein